MVSVALVLVLLGMAAIVGIAGAQLRTQVKRNIGFVAIMEKDCSTEQVNAMKTCLLSQPAIKSFVFSSADEILASESEYMGQDIAAIADVIEGVDAMVRRTTLVLAGLAIILLLVSIALIGNTVSLSVYGRRFIIHTMKLVGATPGFIRRPFVLAGLRDGFIAGVAASALIVALRYYAPSLDPMFDELVGWPATAYICTGMVLLGAVLTSLTALVAANRYLRASYDEMFLK